MRIRVCAWSGCGFRTKLPFPGGSCSLELAADFMPPKIMVMIDEGCNSQLVIRQCWQAEQLR